MKYDCVIKVQYEFMVFTLMMSDIYQWNMVKFYQISCENQVKGFKFKQNFMCDSDICTTLSTLHKSLNSWIISHLNHFKLWINNIVDRILYDVIVSIKDT